MRINLLEIPKEGQVFDLSRQSGELNASLKDLIGDKNYKVQFEISPKPHGFELKGEIETEMPELCSFCGQEIELATQVRFKELLLPEIEQERTSHYSKPNHFSDLHSNEISVWNYKGHHFEAGEYLHQAIALEQAIQPTCPPEDSEACQKRSKELKDKADAEKMSAFADLKKLKLN